MLYYYWVGVADQQTVDSIKPGVGQHLVFDGSISCLSPDIL